MFTQAWAQGTTLGSSRARCSTPARALLAHPYTCGCAARTTTCIFAQALTQGATLGSSMALCIIRTGATSVAFMHLAPLLKWKLL